MDGGEGQRFRHLEGLHAPFPAGVCNASCRSSGEASAPTRQKGGNGRTCSNNATPHAQCIHILNQGSTRHFGPWH